MRILSHESVVGIIIVGAIASSFLLYFYWPLLIANDVLVCKHPGTASVEDSRGFVTVASGPLQGKYEFVLKPGSTGYITMRYNFCPDIMTSIISKPSFTTLQDLTQFLNSTRLQYDGLYRFLDDKGQTVITPPGGTVGVSVYVSEISKLSQDSVRVTYTLNADRTAERGIYLMKLYLSCPGGILTVGEDPIADHMAWTYVRAKCAR